MKSLRTICALSVLTAGIVVFWLAPGINKSETVRYTRVYEDTDQPYIPVMKASFEAPAGDTIKSKSEKVVKPHQKKKYKKESIQAGTKLSKIKPSMFSRAIHFSEEEIVTDSTKTLPASAKAIEQVQVKEKIEK
jgi:hypothetical protein